MVLDPKGATGVAPFPLSPLAPRPLVGDHAPTMDRPTTDPTDRPVTDQADPPVAAARPPTDHGPVSVEAAAIALGISPNAVRQRIKRGTLTGHRTPAGWVVALPTDQPTIHLVGRLPTDRPATDPRPTTDRPADQAAIAPLADLITDLTRQNRELAVAAALWQERARHLEGRVLALEAGPTLGTNVTKVGRSGELPPPAGGKGDGPPQASPASRWRRWLRRLVAGG